MAKGAPQFTRRDYELTAEAIRDARAVFTNPCPEFLDTVLAHMTTFFANKFREDNTRFDVERFLQATFPLKGQTNDNDTGFPD